MNIMISGYGEIYKGEKAVELMERMVISGCQPNDVTCINIIAACVKSGDIKFGVKDGASRMGKQVHAAALKEALDSDMYVGSGLITLYSRSGKVDVAKSIFNGLLAVDIVCWDSIIAGLSLNSLEKEL
ncbi:hypothetical protein RDABS01_009968 [Bienertia sinuspersici]